MNCPHCNSPLKDYSYGMLDEGAHTKLGLPEKWKSLLHEDFICPTCQELSKKNSRPYSFIHIKGMWYFYHNGCWCVKKERKGKLIGGYPTQ